MTNKRVSVIIPIFNSMKYLKACLESVIAAMEDYGNAELILLDNGSTDGSFEILASEYGNTAQISRVTGITVSALRNRGASIARGDYLCFIDSDCVIPKSHFQQAMAVFASTDADAAGNYYDLPPSPCWIEETWDNINLFPGNTYVKFLVTGNLIVKKAVFQRVGGFDETLITGEDVEFGLRLNAAGYRIFASSKIPAVHLGNPKTLREFFRKQIWHGLGMFGSFRHSVLDKPVVMTFIHLALLILSILNLFLGPHTFGFRLFASLALSAAAPVMVVTYRCVKRRSAYRPLRSVLLYYLYFTARVWALFRLAILRITSHVQPHAH